MSAPLCFDLVFDIAHSSTPEQAGQLLSSFVFHVMNYGMSLSGGMGVPRNARPDVLAEATFVVLPAAPRQDCTDLDRHRVFEWLAKQPDVSAVRAGALYSDPPD
jgi:hypothetical protein